MTNTVKKIYIFSFENEFWSVSSVCVYIYVCIYVHMYAHLCVCVCVCVCVWSLVSIAACHVEHSHLSRNVCYREHRLD